MFVYANCLAYQKSLNSASLVILPSLLYKDSQVIGIHFVS